MFGHFFFCNCLADWKKYTTFAPHLQNRCIRGVAQLVAFLVWDQAVAGSSPVTPTRKGATLRAAPFFFK